MKTPIILFIAIFASFTMRANTPETKYSSQVRAKIVKLLENAPFQVSKDVNAQIEFLITKKGEIIVTNVSSNNEFVEGYVKSKLNYKKVAVKDNFKPHFYKMPLKIVKKV